MLPYGFFGDAKLDRDSFLQKAGSDKREHFAFARGRASGSIPLPESQTSTLMQPESSANADSVTSTQVLFRIESVQEQIDYRLLYLNSVRENSAKRLGRSKLSGTLRIEGWASLKSLRPKGEKPTERTPPDDPGNPSVDFHGERRQNATHQSTTDPEARLAKKGAGKEARLCYTESVLMENRNGIIIDLRLGQASGRAESEQGLEMLQELRGPRRITVAGDKGYDTAAFVASCRALNVTPHVAQNERRPGGSALDLRTTNWPGYAVSQRVRKRVEEIFGWIKTVGNFRRTRYRGVERTSFAAYLVGAAYNLLRIAKLCPSG